MAELHLRKSCCAAIVHCAKSCCLICWAATRGIPKIKRADYLVFDRYHLAYLNALEKLNCAYCSYASGLVAYTHEIAARTEQYWCLIKHARRLVGAHARYAAFDDYGDGENYQARLAELRKALAKGE